MANEVLKFLNGQVSNLSTKTVQAGQVYFAINSDGETGSIYFDAPISSTVTKRIAMSGQSVEHANEADYATKDSLGNTITETYISQLRLDNAGTKIQYKYPGVSTWSELQPLFLPLAGGQITNDLGVEGTITAGSLIVNGPARFIQTIQGNITSSDKWATARNFSISDSIAAYTGTTVSVDGSAAVTLPLPATITATLKGNADTATKATQDANGKVIANEYVHRVSNSASTLNQFSGAPQYLLGIESFANGGEVKWQGIGDIKVGSATNADTWTTSRNFSISDYTAAHTGDTVSVNGSAAITLPLPATISASLNGTADRAIADENGINIRENYITNVSHTSNTTEDYLRVTYGSGNSSNKFRLTTITMRVWPVEASN